MQFLFMTLSMLTAIFLILLVLVQRGRGGGLTGALGGMGGQSAFGSKAGDLFTRITIGVAFFWIVLSVLSIKVLNTPKKVLGDTDKTTFDERPGLTDAKKKALPSDAPADSTTDSEAAAAPGAIAPAATESDASPAPATPATKIESPEAPAPKPPASEPPAPTSTEPVPSTEVTPETTATPEKSE
jgi:preprotein translocase subunit SecG